MAFGETRPVRFARRTVSLQTTTVYVTHDQVEAMTLGHRVAVMRPVSENRPYNMQQVAPPTELFNEPLNLFVAGFIGSPAMNLIYGTLSAEGDDVWCSFAGQRVKLAQAALDRHPGLENYMNQRLVAGMRPGDFEDARVAPEDPDRTIGAVTDVNEMLGSDTYAHFTLPEKPVLTTDIEELAAAQDTDLSTLGDETTFSARVSPDVSVPNGSEIRLVLDTTKMHFFDPETNDRIGAKTP